MAATLPGVGYRGRSARPRPLLRASLCFGLVAAASAQAAGPACQQLTEEDGLQALPGCTVVDGRPQLDAALLRRLDYDTHGLATLYVGDSFHYVTGQGRTQAVITWDNGPDYLEEGLLRGRVGDRVGYFTPDLAAAFPATFDFAWPFSDGIAQVCNGCHRGTPDNHGHTPMQGGEWFHIDRRGQRVPDPAGP